MKENGRYHKLESRENEAGQFLLCSITDGEGQRHRIFIPEGRGLIKGWVLLADKLGKLGIKGKTREKREDIGIKEVLFKKVDRAVEGGKEGKPRKSISNHKSPFLSPNWLILYIWR